MNHFFFFFSPLIPGKDSWSPPSRIQMCTPRTCRCFEHTVRLTRLESRACTARRGSRCASPSLQINRLCNPLISGLYDLLWITRWTLNAFCFLRWCNCSPADCRAIYFPLKEKRYWCRSCSDKGFLRLSRFVINKMTTKWWRDEVVLKWSRLLFFFFVPPPPKKMSLGETNKNVLLVGLTHILDWKPKLTRTKQQRAAENKNITPSESSPTKMHQSGKKPPQKHNRNPYKDYKNMHIFIPVNVFESHSNKTQVVCIFLLLFFFFPTQNKTWTFIFSETLPTHCVLPCCQTDTQHIMMSSKLRFRTLISHQYFVASLTDDNISSELYLNVYIFMKRTFEGTIRSRRFTHPAQILRGTTRKLSTLSTPLRNCRKVMKERDSEKVLTPQKTSGGATFFSKVRKQSGWNSHALWWLKRRRRQYRLQIKS